MDQAHGVAGIDPHKSTATVAVVDNCGGRRGCRSFAIDEAGIEELLTFLIDSELVLDRSGSRARPSSAGRWFSPSPPPATTPARSKPTAPPNDAAGAAEPRPTARTPRPSPARR